MEKSPQTPTENPLGHANQLPFVAIGGNPRTSRQDVARDVRICAGCGWADIHINPCASRLKHIIADLDTSKKADSHTGELLLSDYVARRGLL